MNKKFALIALAVVLALLLGGAYVLYEKLGSGVAPDQLAVQTKPTAPTQ